MFMLYVELFQTFLSDMALTVIRFLSRFSNSLVTFTDLTLVQVLSIFFGFIALTLSLIFAVIYIFKLFVC